MHWSGRFLVLLSAAVLIILGLSFVLQLATAPPQTQKAIGGNPRRLVEKTVIDAAKVKQISWHPRLMYYTGFLTPDECKHIIGIGESKVERSMTVGPNGTSVVNPHRTSYGYFLSRESGSDPIIQGIEKRIAQWSHIPQNHGESMNLLKYELGQEYKPHFDFFNGEEWTRNVGNRLATVLMYLSDVEDGGETIFPNAEGGAIKVKPKQGDAVLFYDLTTENQGDNYSLHGSVPVIKGTKWAMTRWIRERKYH